jgi:hypothetical protein
MKNIKTQEGIESIDRVKLLMKYSMGKTLTENLEQLRGNLIKEDSMSAERMINAHNREVLGPDWDKPPVDEFADGKKIIKIPIDKGNMLDVIEGTVYNQFLESDTSKTLFPTLIKDTQNPNKGWYQIVGKQRVYYPKDSFWKPLIGRLKSFKTGNSVESNGKYYHFLIQLSDQDSQWATLSPGTPQDRDDRGWKIQPWYYSTEDGAETPYNPKEIDIRSSGDKFWDDNNWWIQIAGAIILGVVTAGIADVIGAALIAAEVGAAAIEGATLAVEVTSALSAASKARRIGLALDFVVQGAFNGGIGMYEISRGEDPTISFVFALLPLVHNAPFVKGWLGNTLTYTEKECKEIIETLAKFDGTNPNIINTMSKQSQDLFKAVTKASQKNPEGLKNIITETLKLEAAKTAKSPELSKRLLQTVKNAKVTLPPKIVHLATQVGVDIGATGVGVGSVMVYKNWAEIKEHLKKAYQSKFNKEMSDSEADKVIDNAKKNLPTEEEAKSYVEQIALDYETGKEGAKIFEDNPEMANTLYFSEEGKQEAINNFDRAIDEYSKVSVVRKPRQQTSDTLPKPSGLENTPINGISPFGGGLDGN